MYTDFYFDLERVEEKSKITIIKPITLVHLTQERSLSDPLLRFPESLPFGFIVLVPFAEPSLLLFLEFHDFRSSTFNRGGNESPNDLG